MATMDLGTVILILMGAYLTFPLKDTSCFKRALNGSLSIFPTVSLRCPHLAFTHCHSPMSLNSSSVLMLSA